MSQFLTTEFGNPPEIGFFTIKYFSYISINDELDKNVF